MHLILKAPCGVSSELLLLGRCFTELVPVLFVVYSGFCKKKKQNTEFSNALMVNVGLSKQVQPLTAWLQVNIM